MSDTSTPTPSALEGRAAELRAELWALHSPRHTAASARSWGALSSEEAWREALSALWRGRKVAVWGAAKSGLAAANLLAELGADVTLSDSRALERPTELHPNVRLVTGAPNSYEGAELIIPSPGLKPTHPLISAAREAGVPLMSEVELGAWSSRARLVGVTGTDGKSTCTCLITHQLNGRGAQAWGVGNLGEPVCVRALSASPQSFLVCEVSAFQLWSSEAFPAELGLITNIAEDHLDYFDGSFERYARAKLRLIDLVAEVGGCTLTTSEVAARALTSIRPHLKLFGWALSDTHSPSSAPSSALLSATLRGERLEVEGVEMGSVREFKLIGRHNSLNLAAATLALSELGFEAQQALSDAASFEGLPHRCALVRELRGVRWVNDSKATNVHASLAGLKSIDDRLIVIVGGKEKGLEYGELKAHFTERTARGALSAVLLIGELSERLERELSVEGELPYTLMSCETLEHAVKEAARLARSGEMVLLSPASSSFDQFESFEARGACFALCVNALI